VSASARWQVALAVVSTAAAIALPLLAGGWRGLLLVVLASAALFLVAALAGRAATRSFMRRG
jgi:uncharacterized membrane protein YjjP (DUF1212 family)